jgi:hypothetical protein
LADEVARFNQDSISAPPFRLVLSAAEVKEVVCLKEQSGGIDEACSGVY